MDYPCESEIDIQNENALQFRTGTRPAPIIEYIKTIASLIGASHILGVFETNNFIKVYFDDKRYVDTLIGSGIHVMGHHIRVEYVVPPGKKVILSNIDPVVANCDLIKLMSTFGSVVSPVFRSPFSDDIEFCHINYGVRYVYMNLYSSIPNFLEFKYGDQMCKIHVKVEGSLPVINCIKKESLESNTIDSSSNQSPFDDDDDEINVNNESDMTGIVLVSVQSSAENNSDQQNESQSCIETNNPIVSIKKLCKPQNTKFKASRVNKKIKHNVKYKNRRSKRLKISKARRQIKNKACAKELTETPVNKQISPSTSLSRANTSTPLPTIGDNFISKNSRFILDEDKLALFLEEVRYHHAPIDILKKYIGPDFDSNALICFILQLHDLKKNSDDPSVKHRIYRLIKNLQNFVTND